MLWDGVDHEDGPRNRHNVNELSIHIVYATKQSERWTSISGCAGDRRALATPFSTSEANMISLMDVMREGER